MGLKIMTKSKRTRVLLFVDRMRHGGIQQFLVENVRNMDKTKVQIDVLTLDDGTTYPLEQAIQDAGATYYKLKGIWINKPWDYIKYAKAIDKFCESPDQNWTLLDVEAAIKQAIEDFYPDRYWWEVTQCDIPGELFGKDGLYNIVPKIMSKITLCD